jgi:hypothetical protein
MSASVLYGMGDDDLVAAPLADDSYHLVLPRHRLGLAPFDMI